MGRLDSATAKSWNMSTATSLPDLPKASPAATIPAQPPLEKTAVAKRPLHTLINVHDFEEAASTSLTAKTWAFYSSAATDSLTHKHNHDIYNRILLRPRVMRDATLCDTSCTILGRKSTLPFFCAPAALARMAHPDGECAIARACARRGIPEVISTNASYPIDDIFASIHQEPKVETPEGVDTTFFFQLYVDKDRKKSEVLLKKVEKLGAKAIMVTVDAATPGKRELDEKVRSEEAVAAPMSGESYKPDTKGGGIARTMGGFIDSALCWKDIEWLRQHTSLPLVLKGVMTWQDCVLAAEYGVEGVVLSNHGGRNIDTSPPSLLVLLELQRNAPWVFGKLEVIVDGGIKRGTDIFKVSTWGVGKRWVKLTKGRLCVLVPARSVLVAAFFMQ